LRRGADAGWSSGLAKRRCREQLQLQARALGQQADLHLQARMLALGSKGQQQQLWLALLLMRRCQLLTA
jgi:ABC-type cobalamin/Fe3+-siderophores transport system ATPase subunit